MTNAQKAALSAARAAVLGLAAEPQELRGGSIREVAGGFEIRLSTEAGIYLVRTSTDGVVETVTEEQVHHASMG